MPVSMLTQRNGSDRRGVNQEETALNPINLNLNTFGKLGSYPVDGDVYAQPLYVPNVKTVSSKICNVLIVATMNNTVFAFDADAEDPNSAELWQSQLGPAVFAAQFGGGGYHDIVDAVDPERSFTEHTATIGILSTPVIDAQIDPTGVSPTTGTIYLVTFTADEESFQMSHSADEFKHFLHALDLTSGQPVRPAVQIEGKVSGQGYVRSQGHDASTFPFSRYVSIAGTSSIRTVKLGQTEVEVVDCENVNSQSLASVRFNSIMQLQRPALLLHNGSVVVAFGSRGDEDPYHGWIFAYDAKTFDLVGLRCTTPNGAQGGIWQAGQGLLVDSKANVYAGSGNGDSEETVLGTGLQGRNLAESFIQLELGQRNIGVKGWFNAFNDFARPAGAPGQTEGTDPDDDLGASAPALLPDDRVVGGGKDGWFYLLDPDLLNKTGSQSPSAVPQAFKASFNFGRGSRNTLDAHGVDHGTHHIHGTPVVWTSELGTFVYVWGENDVVRVYEYAPEANRDPSTGRFLGQDADFDFTKPPRQGVDLARGNIYASNEDLHRGGMPGGMLSLSLDGSSVSSAILWASFPPYENGNHRAVDGALVAYDASSFDENLGYKRLVMLWNSEQKPSDKLGLLAKFCCPTIANGRVYQATIQKEVAVYGLKAADGGYDIGFGGRTGLALNGSASVTTKGTIRLTDHAHHPLPTPYNDTTPTYNAGSVFALNRVDISSFVTSFTFQLTDAAADGFTFAIQDETAHAIGSAGSGLGYMADPLSPTPIQFQSTITHSFAVKFILSDPDNTRSCFFGLLLNGGQFPNFHDVDLREDVDLDLRSGNPIAAVLRYDGLNLFISLTDTIRNGTKDFQVIVGNIGQQIRSVSGKAFVGFTGGTGTRSARQEIIRWDFSGSNVGAGSFAQLPVHF